MTLCHACQEIPFRKIFAQLVGDETVRDAFLWYHASSTIGLDDSHKRPYIKWHNTIQTLRANAKLCPFCKVIYVRMPEHYRYQTYVQAHDERTVWLEVPGLCKNPIFSVSIGDTRPENIISGNYRCKTTPGQSFEHLELRLVADEACR
jgi:hypothetical protein